MKTLLVAAFFIAANTLFAQTSVIAVKSHHGNDAEISQSVDKFGELAPVPVIDRLVKINDKCVVQIGEDNGWGMPFRDTVCDHWYYRDVNFDADKIREYHGGKIKMVGFDDDSGSVQTKKSPFFNKRSSKQSSKWLALFLVLAGLGAYLISPKILTRFKS
ncbi:MAG: hypothetical protein Crog4KO_15890 [Crocinitomicaceae bacterium]